MGLTLWTTSKEEGATVSIGYTLSPETFQKRFGDELPRPVLDVVTALKVPCLLNEQVGYPTDFWFD